MTKRSEEQEEREEGIDCRMYRENIEHSEEETCMQHAYRTEYEEKRGILFKHITLSLCISAHLLAYVWQHHWIIELTASTHTCSIPCQHVAVVGISACSSDDHDGRRSLTDDEDDNDVKEEGRKEKGNHTEGSTQISLLTLLLYSLFSSPSDATGTSLCSSQHLQLLRL